MPHSEASPLLDLLGAPELLFQIADSLPTRDKCSLCVASSQLNALLKSGSGYQWRLTDTHPSQAAGLCAWAASHDVGELHLSPPSDKTRQAVPGCHKCYAGMHGDFGALAPLFGTRLPLLRTLRLLVPQVEAQLLQLVLWLLSLGRLTCLELIGWTRIPVAALLHAVRNLELDWLRVHVDSDALHVAPRRHLLSITSQARHLELCILHESDSLATCRVVLDSCPRLETLRLRLDNALRYPAACAVCELNFEDVPALTAVAVAVDGLLECAWLPPKVRQLLCADHGWWGPRNFLHRAPRPLYVTALRNADPAHGRRMYAIYFTPGMAAESAAVFDEFVRGGQLLTAATCSQEHEHELWQQLLPG